MLLRTVVHTGKWPSLVCWCARLWRLFYRRWCHETAATLLLCQVLRQCLVWMVLVTTVPARLLQLPSTSQSGQNSMSQTRLEFTWRLSVRFSSTLECLTAANQGYSLACAVGPLCRRAIITIGFHFLVLFHQYCVSLHALDESFHRFLKYIYIIHYHVAHLIIMWVCLCNTAAVSNAMLPFSVNKISRLIRLVSFP